MAFSSVDLTSLSLSFGWSRMWRDYETVRLPVIWLFVVVTKANTVKLLNGARMELVTQFCIN